MEHERTNDVRQNSAFWLAVIRWLVRCGVAAVVIFILWQHLVPTGTLHLRYTVSAQDPPRFFGAFASREPYRLLGKSVVDGATKTFQTITQDPVYFSVPAFRSWQSAEVRVKYQSPQHQPLLRVGVKSSSTGYRFAQLAVENTTLAALYGFWRPVHGDGTVVLWQKDQKAYQAFLQQQRALQKQHDDQVKAGESPVDVQAALNAYDIRPFLQESLPYASVQNFLKTPPDPERIARFNFPEDGFESVPHYLPSKSRTVINASVRGSHTLGVYAGEGENLDVQFFFRDANRHAGNDAIAFSVQYGGRTVFTKTLPDDGVVIGNGKVSKELPYHLMLSNVRQGVYHIHMQMTDDVFLTHFSSLQSILQFEGHVYLTDNAEYSPIIGEKKYSPTTMWTDATTLYAHTAHTQNLQTLRIDDQSLAIPQVLTDVSQKKLTGVSQVTTPQNDVYLSGGNFSFSPSLLSQVVHTPADVDKVADSIDQYDYIIADYPVAPVQQGLSVATATIHPLPPKPAQGDYQFILNAPGLTENHRQLLLYELDVTLHRPGLSLRTFFPRARAYLEKSMHKQ